MAYSDNEATEYVDFGDWCPDCPEKEFLTDKPNMKYCSKHSPSLSGEVDKEANPLGEQFYPATNYEEGDRAICDFIHRGIIARG